MVRMEMLLELYSQTMHNLLESQGMSDLPTDSGKWYSKNNKEKP